MILQIEWFEPLRIYLEQIRQATALHLPSVIGAAVLLFTGWLSASLLRGACRRLMPRLYGLVPSNTFQRGLRSSGVERLASESAARIVYLLVWLLFLAAATETLGLPAVSMLVSSLAQYLPSVLAAVLILVAGIVLGNIARSTIVTTAASTGAAHGALLGSIVRAVVLLIAGVVAIDQIGIDSTFLMVSVAIVMFATVGGLALGFGLGARATVGNLMAMHYVLQTYRIGQRIRVGQVDGRIVQINSTAVVLDTAAGRAFVPASQFNEVTSVLLPDVE
jgi:small-conductance mechanosensitive channel